MPKIKCICGEIIGLGEIPSPNQKLIISDVDYDKYSEGSIDAEKLYQAMTLVVVCPVCNRLYLYDNGFENEPIIYKIE